MRLTRSPELQNSPETISDRLKNATTLAEIFVALKGVNQIFDAENKPLNPLEMIGLIQALNEEIEESKNLFDEGFPQEDFEKIILQIPKWKGLREAVRKILSPRLKKVGENTTDHGKVPVSAAEHNPAKGNSPEKGKPTLGYSGQEMPEHLRNRPIEDQFLLADDIKER
jgi:hypothetical protein